jgi:hypothetical protein
MSTAGGYHCERCHQDFPTLPGDWTCAAARGRDPEENVHVLALQLGQGYPNASLGGRCSCAVSR